MPQETITINQSFIEIKSPNIPDGDTRVTIHNTDDMGVIHDQVVDQSNGEITVKIDSIPNRKALALMMDPAAEPEWLEAANVVSFGDIEMYANETLRIWPGWKDIDRWLTINDSNNRFTTHDLQDGATVSLTSTGLWTIRPNNAFNHLDPGESAILNIPYTQTADTASENLWGDVTSQFNTNTWNYDEATDTYKKISTTSFGNLTFFTPDISIGAVYNLRATITERTGGDVTLRWGDENGNIIGAFAPFGFTGNVTELDRESYPAPPGAGSIIMVPGTPWDGRMKFEFYKVIEAETYNAEIIIKGSEQVGPKVVQREDFLGWPVDGITYQSQSGPLYANYAFKEGHIYEIDVTAQNVTAGTIKPYLVGLTRNTETRYTIAGNERNVFYIRAPQDCDRIEFDHSGFNGELTNIIVKELLVTGVDLPRDYEVSSPESGKLEFWPLVAPKNGRISESQQPDHYYNWKDGNQTSEFGVRQERQESTLVENAEYKARRSAISLKGGPWAEVWNVKIEGGYAGGGNAAKYQTGYQSGDNSPWMEASYLHNMRIDLKLESMRGAYNNQNSDCILFNSNHTLGSRRATGYLTNIDARNASDGVIDNKCIIFARCISLYGGWRTERGHTISQSFLCSSKLDEEAGSQCAIHVANYNETHTLWMSEVNGEYVKSTDQLRDQIKDSGFSALEGDVDVVETKRACVIAKTMPRLPEKCNIQMSDYEIQISPAGTNNWSTLHKTALFEAGTLLKTFDVAPGTYDLRVQYKNGQFVSGWDYNDSLKGIVVS